MAQRAAGKRRQRSSDLSIDQGRDLLFGVIALQMNFITQEQFVEVMTLLPGAAEKRAADIFAERG